MSNRIRFVLNRPGLGVLMTSPKAQAVLVSEATPVAAQIPNSTVEPGISPGGGTVPARARVRVGYPATMSATEALRTEAKHGYLARALGAAGGK